MGGPRQKRQRVARLRKVAKWGWAQETTCRVSGESVWEITLAAGDAVPDRNTWARSLALASPLLIGYFYPPATAPAKFRACS